MTDISFWGCPICGAEIYKADMPDPRFGLRGAQEIERLMYEVDAAALHHLERYHAWRFWLWERLHWNWLVGGYESASAEIDG